MGEETFLSKEFSQALILMNVGLLAVFALTRWIRPSELSVPGLVQRVFRPLPAKMEQEISLRVTPKFVMTTILCSITIGMLCARSLHYQFYAYLAWGTPFLLWRSGLHPILIYIVWATQEWAWNVYPSTDTSSEIVVGVLALQVLAIWLGTRNSSREARRQVRQGNDHEHKA